MRILTVRQPWAWAIIHGGKDVENRARNIAGDYRGPMLIHAGLRPERPGPAWAAAADLGGMNTDRYDGDQLHLGHIIGVVDLVDVHTASVIGGCGRMQHDCDEHPNGCRHHCSRWAMGPAPDGWYQHLVFENPRALEDPIPYRAALGLRKTEFDVVGDYLAAPWGHPKGQVCTPMGCEPGCHLEPVGRLVATS